MKRRLFDRVLTFLLLFTMILSNFNGVIAFAAGEENENYALTTMAEDPADSDPSDNGDGDEEQPKMTEEELLKTYVKPMHFIIRHWHNSEDEVARDNGNQKEQEAGKRFFVVGEGYIVQERPNNYSAYLFRKNDQGEDYLENINVLIDEKSPYFSENGFDSNTGELKFVPYPVNGEVFAGYSISTGHGASTIDGDTLIIKYNPNIHLVKSHVFYTKNEVVSGAPNLGDYGVTDKTKEQDTIWAYVYKEDVDGHKAGDPASNEDKDSDLVEFNKIYDTSIGIHTDKTVREYEETGALKSNGRRFNIDLETWNAEGEIPEVGMVLDASGSMAFTSDLPEPIQIKEGTETYNLLTDKIGRAQTKGFDSSEVEVGFPAYDNLLGYYEFNKTADLREDSKSLYRTWFLNSKKKNPSQFVDDAIYESTDRNYFAQAVLWPDSNEINFTDGQPILHATDYQGLSDYSSVTGWGDAPGNFSAGNGMSLDYSGVGFLLEDAADNQEFTLSFTLSNIEKKSNFYDDSSKVIEILYIGQLRNNKTENNYFHLYRQGGDLIAKLGDKDTGTPLFTVPNIYQNPSQNTYTFVFNENKLSVYLDGYYYTEVDVTGLKGNNVVFTPFKFDVKHENNKDQYFFIDNIYWYKTALEGKDIDILSSVSGNPLAQEIRITQDAFLTPSEVDLLLDSHKTDNSKLGFGDYNYFVFDSASTTQEYVPLGMHNEYEVKERLNTSGRGWYYTSNNGDWTNFNQNGTAKKIYGLDTNNTFTDSIKGEETTAREESINGKTYSFEGAAPQVKQSLIINSNNEYKASSSGPVKFYIDKNGYLRCFFSRSDTSYLTSFVYELEDKEYIKKEALQRALSAFVTDLSSVSPASHVSAVRFSLDVSDENLDKLVLLDWSDDVKENIGIMNLKRGESSGNEADGTSYDRDPISGINEYNYALTGGTNTHLGLKAFLNKLENPNTENITSDADGKKKYLIIFTDGMDDIAKKNNGISNDASNMAKKLKEAGYTIFTVLLNGGPVSKAINADQYNMAENFLTGLSGTLDTTENKSDYFFSIDKIKDDPEYKDLNMNDADILTEIFSEKILNLITEPLEDYTVKDYIDPRFDLVDHQGRVWYLNANGKVQVEGEKIPRDLVKIEHNGEYNEFMASSMEVSTQKAYLRFDSNKNLYYLEWIDQDIPTSYIGAKRLYVWKSTVTVQAKEDFIGGNAVLTNGNDEQMNFVFNPNDPYKSSGTDHTKKEEVTENQGRAINEDQQYVSKGFPRVTVNVRPSYTNSETAQIKFMGERLSSKDAVNNLFDAISKGDFYEKPVEAGLAETVSEVLEEPVQESTDTETETDPEENQTVVETSGRSKYYVEYLNRFIEYYKEHNLPILNGEEESLYDYSLLDSLKNSEKLNLESIIDLLCTGSTETEDGDLITCEPKTIRIPYSYLPSESNQAGDENHQQDYFGFLTYSITEKVGGVEGTGTTASDGVLKNTECRTTVLNIDFETIPVENRIDSVNTLITESKNLPSEDKTDQASPVLEDEDESDTVRAEDKIYKWNPDYKPVEGQSAESQNLSSTIQTDIVSGEIRLVVKLSDDFINTYQGETITYSAQLKYQEEEIGTLDLKDISIIKGKNYYVADLTITNSKFDYGYMERQYGLPLGTYKVSASNSSENYLPGYFDFDEIKLIDPNTESTLYNKDGIFSKGTNFNQANDYVASLSSNNLQAVLGDQNATEGKPYTDYRFALYQVEPKYEVGDLEIKKTVDGSSADPDAQFTFNVELYNQKFTEDFVVKTEDGRSITFTKDSNSNNYTATIEVKANSSIVLKDLPKNTTYTVSETAKNGYKQVTPANNANCTGVITESKKYEAAFLNEKIDEDKYGSLRITKTVIGSAEDQNTEFNFSVTLSDFGDKITGNSVEYALKDSTGKITFRKVGQNYVSSDNKLRHGQSITIVNLPAGIRYDVTEVEANKNGYTTTSTGKTGSIPAGGLATAAFTNEKNSTDPDTGSLEVSKTVDVENGDLTSEDESIDFTFTVKLFKDSIYSMPADFNGILSGIPFSNGIGMFTLRHGQSQLFTGIPAGLYYEVVEGNSDGYTVDIPGNFKGQITKNNLINVSFKNIRTEEQKKPSKKILSPAEGTPVKRGDQIVYEIDWENTTSDPATIVITDELDEKVNFVTASHDGTYDPATGIVTWSLGLKNPKEKGFVTLTVEVISDVAFIENIANVIVGDQEPEQTNKVETPVWVPEKTEESPGEGKTVLPEDEITYKITWKNYKDVPATIVITDPLDPGVDFISTPDGGEYNKETHTVVWTLRDVEPNKEGSVTLTVKVNEEAFKAMVVKNQATVKVGDDPETKTRVIENPTWKPEKKVKSSVPEGGLKVGDQITYQISWKNYKSDKAQVKITDELDPGVDFISASEPGQYDSATHTVTWDLGEQEPGIGGEVELTIQVNSKAVQPGKVSNTGQVQVDNKSSVTNEVVTDVQDPSGTVLLSKTQKVEGKDSSYHTNDRIVSPGDTISYDLEVRNTKETAVTGVAVTDTIPENLYFNRESVSIKTSTNNGQKASYSYLENTRELIVNISTLEPQETVHISFNAAVGNNSRETWWINHAYLTYDTIHEEPAYKTQSLNSLMGLFSKLFSVNAAEESNSKSQSRLGHDESYMTGIPLDAAVYHSKDQVKNGLYMYSADLRISARIDEKPDMPTLVKEQSSEYNIRTKNQIVVNRDETMTYYLTVTNPTPNMITNVVVSDAVPIGLEYIPNSASNNGEFVNGVITWNISGIAPNGSCELSFKVKVLNNEVYFHWENTATMNWRENTTGRAIISNTVISDTPQLKIKKEQSTSGQLTVERTEDYIEFIPGDVITYYITVTNISNVPAHNVVIRDPAPRGMTFIPESATTGVRIEDNVLIWTIAELLPGNNNTIEVSFSCDLPEVVNEPIYFHNIAYVSWNENGPNNPLASNETVLGDPPRNNEEGDTPNNPGSGNTPTPGNPGGSTTNNGTTTDTPDTAVKKTTETTTVTKQTNVSQVGASPQTGVAGGLSAGGFLAVAAFVTYLQSLSLKKRGRKEEDK